MPYVVGLVLSLCVAVFAWCVGFDRDRAFYPTVLIVVGAFYVLFAAMSGSGRTVLVESVVMAAFVIAAVVGYKVNPWIVAAGLAGHGVLDAFHSQIVTNSGVPVWWPAFCGTYDIGAAACLAWVLTRRTAGGSGPATVRG